MCESLQVYQLNPLRKKYELHTHTGAGAYIHIQLIVQELCESRGGRPELSVLTSLLVSVDVKNY